MNALMQPARLLLITLTLALVTSCASKTPVLIESSSETVQATAEYVIDVDCENLKPSPLPESVRLAIENLPDVPYLELTEDQRVVSDMFTHAQRAAINWQTYCNPK